MSFAQPDPKEQFLGLLVYNDFGTDDVAILSTMDNVYLYIFDILLDKTPN